jgi:hypothetical protein
MMTWDSQVIDGVKVVTSKDGVYEMVKNHLERYDLTHHGSYLNSFDTIKDGKEYAKKYKKFR